MEKQISISSKIENLNKIEKMVDEVSEECKLSSEIYGKVLIATIEAVNNSILHGNKLDETKEVKIEFAVIDKRLKICIEDEGPGFDFNNVPDPTLPQNIENIHGRGVFLMDHLCDDINFEKNGARVEMFFNIN